MKTRTLLEVLHVVQKARKDIEKIADVYPKRYKAELEDIGNKVVADWYASYEPIMYERHMGLKKAFKVSLHGTDYNVEFSPEYMDDVYGENRSGERVSKDYIYDIAFVQGYHGGATSGPGHPNPGIPYWKKYSYNMLNQSWNFYSWGRPAYRSASPYYRMQSEMKKKIKELDKERNDKLNKIMDRVESSVDRLL